jgi:hypothetical protein
MSIEADLFDTSTSKTSFLIKVTEKLGLKPRRFTTAFSSSLDF